MTDQLTAPESALIQWLADTVGLSREVEAELARRLAGMRAELRKQVFDASVALEEAESRIAALKARQQDDFDCASRDIDRVARERDAARKELAALRAPQAVAPSEGDPWTPSGKDYDRSIHSNRDAAAWADFFVATFPGLADKRDTMLGWFANAMMAMHDSLKAPPSGNDKLRRLRERVVGRKWDRTWVTEEIDRLLAEPIEPAAADGELLAAHEEIDALLSDLADSYESLRAVDVFRDWPADTVLGGNGADAIRELERARSGIGGRLANYPDRELNRARHRARMQKKLVAAKERLAAIAKAREGQR